uniref:Copia protein n=1 Tax=Cajanus cajan TaxID=3821 RepID=A0A151TYE5_CAJCA|nr:Copia protein [Cajanus cajan]
MPTTVLNMATPFEKLFHSPPNYSKLRVFGCLCFPWLGPYTTNKLQAKSKPCIFLGYSPTQSAYLCYNLESKNLYTSRHVTFIEDTFPHASLISPPKNPSIPLIPPITNKSISQPFLPTLSNQDPMHHSLSNPIIPVISWQCKKQQTIAKSSTEAEYRTIGSTADELLWFRELFRELRLPFALPPTVYSDNIGATYLCANPVFHSRMKHLAIHYHFVRDLVTNKEIQVHHIPSSHQLADLLTKSLSPTWHSTLMTKIGVLSSTTILRGRIGVIKS